MTTAAVDRETDFADRQIRADRLARQVHEAMEAGFDAGYRTALDIIEGYIDRSVAERGEAGDMQRFVAYLKRAIATARQRIGQTANGKPQASNRQSEMPLVHTGQGDYARDILP